MDIKIFNTRNSVLLKKALDVYSKEQAAIAKNIANVNNPKYERTNTDFSKLLETEMKNSPLAASDPRHITSSKFHRQSGGPDEREGTVELTREMSDLAANQIRHEFVSKVLKRYYSGISNAIIGRNR